MEILILEPEMQITNIGSASQSQSDDSGCVAHTVHTSSISISDSSRIFNFEAVESDGEVSQFDSLSEGGKSANFNTLKKGPGPVSSVTAIDPPPEFQDSPQTTLLRTKGYHDFAQLLLKDIMGEAFLSLLQHRPPRAGEAFDGGAAAQEVERGRLHRSRISASDPQLAPLGTPVVENIYDDPSDSTRNSDDIEVDYYLSKQVSSSLARKKSSTLSSNSQQLLLRPNSRNSSRLSSSHNSLATTGASKVDDTTFITQAMSHDPLMSRQSILDLYNVPLDSDIYALPVDVVSPDEAAKGENGTRPGTTFRFPGNARLSLSKSSEAKRKLFRKAQHGAASGSSRMASKSASASHSQLVVVVPTSGGDGNAKRFSAPDELAIGGAGEVSSGKATQKQKRRVKREKRNGNGSNSHQVHPCAGGGQKTTSVTSESSDEAAADGGEPGTNRTSAIGYDDKRKRNAKEARDQMLIAISNRKLIPKEKKKKTSIPVSTSFTSQPTMAQSAGAAASLPEGSGKTTKRGHNQFSTNLKKFCSIFRFRNNKASSQLALTDYGYVAAGGHSKANPGAVVPATPASSSSSSKSSATTIMLRALPPLPKRAPPEVPPVTPVSGDQEPTNNRRRPPAELPAAAAASTVAAPAPASSAVVVEIDSNNNDVLPSVEPESSRRTRASGRVDFASNLEKIKQYGWYWGPISCQAAEKILSNEPDGSFLVRDSSDDHYIFSLTFKLNNCVRHVRIEQDKGTFSFGQLAKFKARTIVEFIEQALEYSRSGRYLFFLHRRPEHGPMRVQLKNPVSRFKHIQSLQHMCRFVIMKTIVRKDLISSLPLPNRLKDYLAFKNCYTEHFLDVEDVTVAGAVDGGEDIANSSATTTTAPGTQEP